MGSCETKMEDLPVEMLEHTNQYLSAAKMEDLPVEMLEHTNQYLSASDLASCCAASPTWREIFGQDSLWMVHCDKTLPENLDISRCVVNPPFISPETDESTLSAVGEWRMNYMKETRLRNNLNLGLCEVNESRYLIEPNRFVYRMFFKNDYILIFRESEFEAWDVKKMPIAQTKFSLKLYKSFHFKAFEVTGTDKLVTVEGCLVRVFSLCLTTNTLQMLHMFSLEMAEKTEGVDEESFIKEVKLGLVAVKVVGNILVGVVSFEPAQQIHIWNVETGHKAKEEDSPIDKMRYLSIKACKKTMNIILTGLEDKEGKCFVHWYVYSLNRLKFLPFHKVQETKREFYHSPDHTYSAINDKYIAVCSEGAMCVYNYVTSKLLYTATYVWGLFFNRNYLVFKHVTTWHAFNPWNQKATAHFDSNGDPHSENAGLDLTIVSRPLQGDSCVITTFKIKDGCKTVPLLFTQSSGLSYSKANQSGTTLMWKLQKTDKLTVVHFW